MVEHVERWASMEPASPKGFCDEPKLLRMLPNRRTFSQIVKHESHGHTLVMSTEVVILSG